MTPFKLNDRVTIKQTTTDLNYWLRQARDSRTLLTVIAVDYSNDTFQVKVEYFCPDGFRMTALFKSEELESPAMITPNLPIYTAACPERTALYLRLVFMSRYDFTEQDCNDWLTATGWRMVALKADRL